MGGVIKVIPSSTAIVVLSLALLIPFPRDSKAQISDTTPSPATRSVLTPSPTPLVIQDVRATQRCVSAPNVDATSPNDAIDVLVHLLNTEPLLDFFNRGGTVEALRTALDTAGNMVGPYLSQVIEQDITDDAIPEVFLAITDAIGSAGYGESHLIMFQCVESRYKEMILFQRAGAGSRAEGLYTGGGVHILSIADLNGNGAMDLVFEVDWSDDYGDYAEYYVLEWRDDNFHTILEYQDALHETRNFIQSQTIGDVALINLNGDSRYALVVDGVSYRWDGEVYKADENAN